MSQSFSDSGLIVVDDCSTDNSVEVIQSFVERDSRIKLVRLSKNSGAAVARNTAIEVAQGRYIAFLDSDELWLPDKLKKQLAFMQANDYPFSYAAYGKIDEDDQVFRLEHIRPGKPQQGAYVEHHNETVRYGWLNQYLAWRHR